ncbi:protein translocase subunit SecF, partial [Candidatus Woesearchaeota archaeon]|nr:protein translocase subunit SecF [Candidatus Woesearchaeota archaeon]
KPEDTAEAKPEGTRETEIDLVDEQGRKQKLEIYEEKKEVKEKAEEKREEQKEEKKARENKEEEHKEPKKPILKRVLNFYDTQYKKLAIIPIVVFILAIIIIGIQTATTGSFINKDVSLKGGVTITITKGAEADIISMEKFLSDRFRGNDVSVRSINKAGAQIGIVVVADIDGTNKEELNSFIEGIESFIGYGLEEQDYSTEVMGSSLGESFFKETFIALIFAFMLMSIVVFIYFRTFVPSLAVVLSALSDIIVTLAVVDLTGMRIGTGGIAAFLMLVGYSVDTDMLLATTLLKKKEGTVFDRVMKSFRTGIMMSLTTMTALITGIIFVESAVIRQIMIIVLIGLVVDNMSTWIQNVGILRYYLERKAGKVKNE